MMSIRGVSSSRSSAAFSARDNALPPMGFNAGDLTSAMVSELSVAVHDAERVRTSQSLRDMCEHPSINTAREADRTIRMPVAHEQCERAPCAWACRKVPQGEEQGKGESIDQQTLMILQLFLRPHGLHCGSRPVSCVHVSGDDADQRPQQLSLQRNGQCETVGRPRPSSF
jgi:hypothetical protein